MGVPNFYSWLCKRYPLCRYPITTHHGHHVDFLYLDMNQVIYKCATNQTILKDQMIERTLEDIWTSILNYINEIIKIIDPQQLVYLAFDGVAPRAKANQQRQRRFASSKGDLKIQQLLQSLNLEQMNTSFKNNQITAGTEFMQELNEQVIFFIKCKFQEDEKFKKLKVIFSGSDVPGEGEHKILEFIRNMKSSNDFNPLWTHCIYSADADLIMLGLGIHIEYISIIRETGSMDRGTTQVASKRDNVPISFELINLTIVKQYLDLEYSKVTMKIEYNINRVIDDFLLLFFLVGNDFLPRVYCFDIKQGTVELLIETFKQFLQETDDYVTQNGDINWKQMTLLSQLLSKFEIKAIEKRTEELKKQVKQIDHPEYEDYNVKWQDELKVLESLQISFNNDDNNLARIQFYQTKCNIDINTENGKNQISNMVNNYLQGIQFVLQYYYKGIPSWEWYYNHYYSPMCFDIYLYLLENHNLSFTFQQSQPYEPYQQLLLILPPHNSSLLPQPYRILYDQQSPFRQPFDYYPSEYEIDPFGAIWDHQFISKVPFMNSQLLQQEYNKIDKSNLTEKEIQRCQFGTNHIFFYNSQKQKVKSSLPNIYQDNEYTYKEIILNEQDSNSILKLLTKQNNDHLQSLLPIYPSLTVLQITNFALKTRKDNNYKHQKLGKIEIQSKDIRFINELEQKSNKSESFQCYCGYPQSYFGEVGLIITKQSFFFLRNFILEDFNCLQDYDNIKEQHEEIYKDLLNQVIITLDQKGIYIPQINGIAVVFFYKEIIRNQDRSFTYNMKRLREEIMPIEFISENKIVELRDYRIKQNQTLLQINQQVITIGQNTQLQTGSTGKIIEKSTNNNYVVQIQKQPILKQSNIINLKYYELQYISEELNIDKDVIMYILGSVRIFLGDKKKQTDIIAQQVDIGFNATHRGRNQLVPELVRINGAIFDLEGYEKYQQFQQIELSEILVQDLKEYKNKLPELFEFLASSGKEKLKSLQMIKVKDLFKNDEKNGFNIILKTYIWMLSLPTSHLYQCNVATSQLSTKMIKEIEKETIFKEVNDIFIFTQKEWIINQEKYFVPPLMNEHPPIHKLGDRVISLNNHYASFGSYGTIVGITDIGQIIVEVVWDKPQFGLTNIGGKCSPLRGSIVKFLDIFNLTQNWEKQLNTKQGGTQQNQQGWTYEQKIYQPNFDKPENKIKKNNKNKATNQ